VLATTASIRAPAPPSSYVSTRQHTSASVSIRQHTSAYVRTAASIDTPAAAHLSSGSCSCQLLGKYQ
jgi:hypothetical protein